MRKLPLKQFYIAHPRIQLFTLTVSIPLVIVVWLILVVPPCIWEHGIREVGRNFKEEIIYSYQYSYQSVWQRIKK